MEGIIDDPSLFLNAALENGRVDGVTYGIPYSCTLYSLVFSQKVAGDRQSWTVEEMMKAVRESEAKTLYWYFSQNNAYSIVLQCGLYDNENTAYIDWKAGESHLDEQPFMELLKFAKEYGDNGDYDSAEVLSKLQGVKSQDLSFICGNRDNWTMQRLVLQEKLPMWDIPPVPGKRESMSGRTACM